MTVKEFIMVQENRLGIVVGILVFFVTADV
jgi:hypothetical protein